MTTLLITSAQPEDKAKLVAVSRQVSLAQAGDIEDIKKLAEANRDIFGFITRQAFQEAFDQQTLLVAIVNQQVIGFCRYHHRKTDRQTTLYDICVADSYRNEGLGSALLEALIQDCQSRQRQFIQLKCPTHLLANQFYAHNGFSLVTTLPGKRQALNIWRLNLSEANYQ